MRNSTTFAASSSPTTLTIRKAREAAEVAISLMPSHVLAHVLLGDLALAEGKRADAGAHYGDALKFAAPGSSQRQIAEERTEALENMSRKATDPDWRPVQVLNMPRPIYSRKAEAYQVSGEVS